MSDDLIRRRDAIDALWEALYEYEDKTKKQFQESEDLDVEDWIEHRAFVQNMNDIDRQTIINLPSAQPERVNEGWKIIGSIPVSESEFVLGYNENNKCTPYVTWACTKRDGQYSYYWGHYHKDLKVATLDMIDRAKNSLKGT